MRFILLLTLFFISTSLFCQDTTYFNKNWEKSSKTNAEFYHVIEKADDYWLVNDFYISGQPQMKGKYSNLFKTTKEGVFTWYYANGKKEGEGKYVNGFKEAKFLWYFKNGNLQSEEHYVTGKLNGEYIQYFENKKVNFKVQYLNDVLVGKAIYYHSTGNKSQEGEFNNGDKFGKWQYWYPDGKFAGEEIRQQKFNISEAGLSLQFPNNKWFLAEKADTNNYVVYIFKREPILNNQNIKIIPNISVIIEDFGVNDLIGYSVLKRTNLPFKVETVMAHEKGDFKIENALGYIGKSLYKNGEEHSLYMLHAINKGKGIQVIMDMTTDIFKKYEIEFKKTLQSITIDKN